MRKLFILPLLFLSILPAKAQRQMEFLDRGVVAVRNAEGKVFVSWRLLATEPTDLAFNLYRNSKGKIEETEMKRRERTSATRNPGN